MATLTACLIGGVSGCARLNVQPIEVKPIHITVDITIRIDRALDDFFAQPPTGVPATHATAPTGGSATAAAPAPATTTAPSAGPATDAAVVSP